MSSRLDIYAYTGNEVRVKAPPSIWDSLVSATIAAAAGGGRIRRVTKAAYNLIRSILGRLGFTIELVGDELVIESFGEKAGGEATINIGCSYDLAVYASIVAAALAPPGMRVVIRGCDELVEADWSPVVETIAALGARAWPTGNPKSLIIVEAAGLTRVKTGLWRLRVTSETVAHVAAALAVTPSAESEIYIRVWPREPHTKCELTPVVCKLLRIGVLESRDARYTRFKLNPSGLAGKLELEAEPDYSLASMLVALAALGVKVEIETWGGCSEEFDDSEVVAILLEQLGYRARRHRGLLTVNTFETPIATRYWLEDNPSLAPLVLATAVATGIDFIVDGVKGEHRKTLRELGDALAALAFKVEGGEGMLRVAGLDESLLKMMETPTLTCTTPHILPLALIAATRLKRRIVVERADCLRGLWDELYQTIGAATNG